MSARPPQLGQEQGPLLQTGHCFHPISLKKDSTVTPGWDPLVTVQPPCGRASWRRCGGRANGCGSGGALCGSPGTLTAIPGASLVGGHGGGSGAGEPRPQLTGCQRGLTVALAQFPFVPSSWRACQRQGLSSSPPHLGVLASARC